MFLNVKMVMRKRASCWGEVLEKVKEGDYGVKKGISVSVSFCER